MIQRVGQFTVPAAAGVQLAATQIAASTQTGSQTAGIVPSIRQATVVSADGGTPPTCTITFDGTTNVPGIQYAYPYIPQAGDVVYCMVLSGVTWVLCELTTVAAVVNNNLPLGPVGTVDNGYTTTLGVAWHNANVSVPASQTEIHSDFRITVPACSNRLIELRYTGMIQFLAPTIGGNASVYKLHVYSGGLGTQLAQANKTGPDNGYYDGVHLRRRMQGPTSPTTYTVSHGGAVANTSISANGYPAMLTIDDVGSA